MSCPLGWEGFGPWSLAPSIPKRAQPSLLGHTRTRRRQPGSASVTVPRCRGAGSAGTCPRRDGAQQPGRAPGAATAAPGV